MGRAVLLPVLALLLVVIASPGYARRLRTDDALVPHHARGLQQSIGDQLAALGAGLVDLAGQQAAAVGGSDTSVPTAKPPTAAPTTAAGGSTAAPSAGTAAPTATGTDAPTAAPTVDPATALDPINVDISDSATGDELASYGQQLVNVFG